MHKIILLFSLLALSYSQQAEITNIQAAQRTDGSQMVDIEYDIYFIHNINIIYFL